MATTSDETETIRIAKVIPISNQRWPILWGWWLCSGSMFIRWPYRSDGETCSTAAGRAGVGIVDLEGRADQVVDIVEFGALQKIQRHRINQYYSAVAFDHEIVVVALVIQRKIILESRAAAPGHLQPQHHGCLLRLENLG